MWGGLITGPVTAMRKRTQTQTLEFYTLLNKIQCIGAVEVVLRRDTYDSDKYWVCYLNQRRKVMVCIYPVPTDCSYVCSKPFLM